MKAKLSLAILIVCSCFSFSPVYAAGQALGSCMVDSMTGRERKETARWVFFAIAAHPEIKQYSQVSPETKEKADKNLAALVTKLLTEDCLEQAQTAVKEEGDAAIIGAFELVGEVAMMELMMNNDVAQAIGSYARFLDYEKLQIISSEN